MSNQLLTEAEVGLLTEDLQALIKEHPTPFWTNTNNTLVQQDDGNLLLQDDSYIVLQTYEAFADNWSRQSTEEDTFRRTMFNLMQQDGGNLLFEDGSFVADQAFGQTVWTRVDG